VISQRIEEGESHPWRYGEPTEKGSLTNTRLFRFASMIPGGKLYGSATANMLYDGPGMSRKLEGFKEDSMQDSLRQVLCWVLESMPHVEWVACLGKEAWFLTCNTLGDALAVKQFQGYRESYRSISGIVGEKKICAFPLYHPAARGDAINDMESGWRSFAKLLSAQSNVNGDPLPPELFSPTKGMTRLWTRRRGFLVNPVRRKAKRIVDATLPKRACRVQFIVEGQVVHTSKRYDSCNTCENIIKFARSKRGGAPPNLPVAAIAVLQVLTSDGWTDDDNVE
jgi:hypothetical protein